MRDQTLRSERLLLRPPRAGDADDVYRNIADWDVIRMIARPPWPYPRELADAFVRTAEALMIEFENEVIGAIGIADRSFGGNLGFWLGKCHWGKGLMTEAARLLVAAYFENRGDVSLHSSYLVDNTASWRVQEKLGFIEVGSCTLHINSRGADLPGIRTLLTRTAFKAKSA